MNIVVTGGLGFIGSHLVDRLLSEGCHTILVVDNLLNNAVEPSYFSNRCYTYIKSIDDFVSTFSPLNSFTSKIDLIFHCASIVGPAGVLRFPGNLAINILTDSIVLRNFCTHHNATLIDISSSEIYGHTGSLSETSDKIFPAEYQVRTEYGAAKMVAEIALVNKARIDPELKFQIIRPFNVIGERQKPDCGFVLPRFVIAGLTGQPLTIYGDGSQLRAFTDVEDICSAIMRIAFSEFKNEIWNIGNPKNIISINALASLVALILDKPCKTELIDPKKIHGELFSDVPDKIPNIDKLSSCLHWHPEVPLEISIGKVIDYYKNKINNGYYFKVI